MTYIHELTDWPDFRWDDAALAVMLADVRHLQGRLIGRMESLGFGLREESVLDSLTEEVVKSSKIEGEQLDRDQVRSSVARRLGIETGGVVKPDRQVEGVVEMMIDATHNYRSALTSERLFGWHAALFPTGFAGISKINAGRWRDDSAGPIQVVSGPIGREKVHFEAPKAERVPNEIQAFLAWFEMQKPLDPVITAGIAHLWFATIHPFDDGNGRIARAITDLALARSEKTAQRFYSMSSQIMETRREYYDELERTQKDGLDITRWLDWFLRCLASALDRSEETLGKVLGKARFWESVRDTTLNPRQQMVLNRLLDGFDGNLTSSKWARLAKSSQDTAARDIDDLIRKGILVRGPAGGRSTSYNLATEPATTKTAEE